MRRSTLFIAMGLLFSASPALADPCRAISDQGHWPSWLHPGTNFGGMVRYVGDGDSLCVGRTSDPAQWIEVRLADFNAPELSEPAGPAARAALLKIAFGQRIHCLADHRSWDRVVAFCWLGRMSLGDRLRRQGVAEGGRRRLIDQPPPSRPRPADRPN